MSKATCECGHERRDHRQPALGTHLYGECKVCLCDLYRKQQTETPALEAAL